MQMQMQAQTEGKTRVNRGKANANANASARNGKFSIPCAAHLCCASSHVSFLASHVFASHVWTELNANASTNASKRSVTCPPSCKKSLTAPAYLTFLAFAFYVWTSLEFALASASYVWTTVGYLITLLIKTITKFSNLIRYQRPDLSTQWDSLYVMRVIRQLDGVMGQLMLCACCYVDYRVHSLWQFR